MGSTAAYWLPNALAVMASVYKNSGKLTIGVGTPANWNTVIIIAGASLPK
jgi:hypothetical protein